MSLRSPLVICALILSTALPVRGQQMNHGRDVDGAEEMWVAVIGPDTPALGERRNATSVTQAQIAATIAALLGLDYLSDQARAAKPIGDVIR
jgi:hypothetical protein